ncbi:alpha/beta fold hydrolase [Streptomyces sp. NPDC059447]|uniref:alpha/beta fold hydrolase n=1 Tax=Streptomyces sp. NPDC059447 TaxID=3346834 RepID=UPI00369160B9
MPLFSAYDGTELAYREVGDGAPLVCLPGGPMIDSAYLDELGGLSAHRRLIVPDLRGTGRSAIPADPAGYRCDRLVDDVEALREHLGLRHIDLLGHSAGANLAALYAARHPRRIGRMVLITPSVAAVGIEVSAETRLRTARRHSHQPWFAKAYAALEAILAGQWTPENRQAIEPLSHGRWDAEAQARKEAEEASRNHEAASVYGCEGAYDPAATRAALAEFDRPVMLLAGKVDTGAPPEAVAEYAELFQDSWLVVQRRAGHYPWRDDPKAFTTELLQFVD